MQLKVYSTLRIDRTEKYLALELAGQLCEGEKGRKTDLGGCIYKLRTNPLKLFTTMKTLKLVQVHENNVFNKIILTQFQYKVNRKFVKQISFPLANGESQGRYLGPKS